MSWPGTNASQTVTRGDGRAAEQNLGGRQFSKHLLVDVQTTRNSCGHTKYNAFKQRIHAPTRSLVGQMMRTRLQLILFFDCHRGGILPILKRSRLAPKSGSSGLDDNSSAAKSKYLVNA